MSVFIRTDYPVAPETATRSTGAVNSGTTTKSLTLYYTRYTIEAESERIITSLSITLTARSVVTAALVAFVTDLSYFDHSLYIGGQYVDTAPGASQTRLLRLSGYRVLPPGNYTIEYGIYNNDVSLRTVDFNTGVANSPALHLIAFVVPLE